MTNEIMEQPFTELTEAGGIAIVTGASSGLGQFFAERFDESPDVQEIWLIARRESRLESLARHFRTPCRVFAMDLLEEDWSALEAALAEPGVRIKYLVNNAGFGKIGEFETVSLEDSRNMVHLNCEVPVRLTLLCDPRLMEGATVFNIASVAAFLPQPEFAVYAASKSFVRQWSIALAHEKSYRDRKINLIAVCPNPMETEFFETAAGSSARKAKTIKSIGVESAEDVVDTAMERARRGRRQSINSLIPKLIHLGARLIPWNWILWIERHLLRLFR